MSYATQPRLWRTPSPCAFGDYGEFWHGQHHCPTCAAWAEEACRQFDAAVARGEYDRQGFTPAERKAQQRRVA